MSDPLQQVPPGMVVLHFIGSTAGQVQGCRNAADAIAHAAQLNRDNAKRGIAERWFHMATFQHEAHIRQQARGAAATRSPK